MAGKASPESLEREHLLEAYLRDRTNESARHRFIEANKGIIPYVINRYFANVPLELREDIVQEGWIGVCLAINKFDPAKKTRFSSYCVYWVKQRIQRYLSSKTAHIYVPANGQDGYAKLGMAEKLYQAKYGYPPASDRELADFLGCTTELVEYARRVLQPAYFTSLNAPLSEDRDALEELVADIKAADPFAGLIDSMYVDEMPTEVLIAALKLLTDRERTAIGLSLQSSSYDQVAKRMGISKQRVSGLAKKGMRRMRLYLGANTNAPFTLTERESDQTTDQSQEEARNKPGLSIAAFIRTVKEKEAEMGVAKPSARRKKRT